MTIKIDSDNLKDGLLGLVIALVEIIKEVLQRQAIHRFESNSLSEIEAEHLGNALMQLDKTIKDIKTEHNIGNVADKIRSDLDNLVEDVVNKILKPEEWNENVKTIK